MSTLTENYAQNMIAAWTSPSEGGEVAQIEAVGHGLRTVDPVGAVAVAVKRDMPAILQKLKVLAGAAGQKYFYRFPVKNKDGSKGSIEGPSIDCALAVARTYGNCDVDCRAQDNGDHWMFLARFRDFETGFTLQRAFQQRKGQKTMKTDEGRQNDIVFQIGQSKAIRNVITNALSDLTDFAFDEAKSNLVERVGKRLEVYREKVLSRLAEMKIDVKRVEIIVGRTAGEWLAPEVTRIIGELQAIGDGMATADELYPKIADDATPPAAEPQRKDTAPKAEACPTVEPFDWAGYAELAIDAFGECATIEALDEEWAATSERMDERQAPPDIRQSLVNAKTEREAILRAPQTRKK